MIDRYGRKIDYLRVSVTDRCNLRCRYCMPEDIELVPMQDVLSYEEIETVCTAAAQLGIKKLKITGGEPLVRRGCAQLVARLKAIDGVEQVTMTTNGILLGVYLRELVDAGLDAVNISLDTLRADRFAAITGRDGLETVLGSIDAALDTPLRVKINTVLQQGVNEDELFDLALLAKDRALDLRFIEMMPIGFGREVKGVSNETVRAALQERFPEMRADLSVHGNGPAVYVKIPGWRGGIGFISAIHGRFCSGCNRVRLTAQGRLKLCLCYGETAELMPTLRSGASREKILSALREEMEKAIYEKPLQHCFEQPELVTETARMSGIGG